MIPLDESHTDKLIKNLLQNTNSKIDIFLKIEDMEFNYMSSIF